MKIDKPGKYVTRDGDVIHVHIVDWPGRFPVVGHRHGAEAIIRWMPDGRLIDGHTCQRDIVDVYRPMVEREGWVNVFRINGIPYSGTFRIFDTESEAEAARTTPNHVAVGHITWKEPAE